MTAGVLLCYRELCSDDALVPLGGLQEDTQEQDSQHSADYHGDGVVDFIAQAHGLPQQTHTFRSCHEVSHGNGGHKGCGGDIRGI